jgi:HAMP domain-containing protein
MNSGAAFITKSSAKWLSAVALGVVLATCAVAPASSSAAATSNLKPSTKRVACGKVAVRSEQICGVVSFKNTSSSPVTISATGIEASQSSFGADSVLSPACSAGRIVPAGEACVKRVFFIPAHAGRFSGAKLFVTDATSGVPARVALTGIGV